MPSCAPVPTSGARLDRLVPPFGAKYERAPRRIESSGGPDSPGRWLSGRKHPPAKRVGGVKLPRGFESLPSRHCHVSRLSGPLSQLIGDQSRCRHGLVDPIWVEDQLADGDAVVGADTDVSAGDEEDDRLFFVGSADLNVTEMT